MSDDPFVTFDGAYVLGILDLPDRRAFELHLAVCDRCVAAVASLQDLPARLSTYRPPELAASDPRPDVWAGLLPALRADLARQRRRRHGVMAAAVVALLACVTAIAVLATNASTRARPTATPLAFTALVASPVHASADVRSVAWGTRIDLRCTYDDAHVGPGISYGLVVIGRDNVAYQLGDWRLVPGRATIFSAGTALARADIADLQITTASGVAVLQLTL